VGEHGFALFLRSYGIDAEVAAQAAAGWGGDRVVVLAREGETRPERTVGLARFEWDSEADAMEAHQAAVRAIDGTMIGATAEHDELHTKWLGLDGRVTYVERRGTSVVIAIGVPVTTAGAAIVELWTPTTP
jgi:hypothetical protein